MTMCRRTTRATALTGWHHGLYAWIARGMGDWVFPLRTCWLLGWDIRYRRGQGVRSGIHMEYGGRLSGMMNTEVHLGGGSDYRYQTIA